MKKHHWFDFVEYLSLIGLGAGSVMAVVSKQILYTSAPLSFALLIGFANRRRVEQAQDQKLSDSLASLEQKLSKNLKLIDQKVQNMPTPEMVGDVRQSILRHNREKITKLYSYIHNVKREVENRLSSLDQQNLGETREEINQLQLQYADLYNTLTGVSASLNKAVTAERIEELDQSITKLTVDADQIQSSVKTLNEYSKHTLANLQDQVNQLNRQLKSLPPQVDASSIKREVSELVRVVADLVPKRDLNAIVSDIRTMQRQQTNQLQVEDSLRHDVQEVRKRLQSLPDVPHLRSQLEESFTREIRTINHQLRTLYNSPELRTKIEEVIRGEVGNLKELMADQLPSTPYDLVFDLATDAGGDGSPIISGSRKALSDAIDNTQERLIVIWPWSPHTELDGPLMRQLEMLLKRKRQLDVGWCHVSDRQNDRFLSIINRRWSINPLSQGALQGTLKRLLALKRHYPDHFRFKILGTAENFLISDSSFAVLGLDARLKTQTFLQNAELKLRTTDELVIQQLVQRFDETDPPTNDIEAYWNRAVTRYDLGDKAGAIADLDTILSFEPDDPALYNLRGIIRYEQKDAAGALEDLNQSIDLSPDQHAAYCNRGYIQSEHGDQYGAIADFSLAIQSNPESSIAYFYRGAASQKLEDYEGAIADYTAALNVTSDAPVVLYQRGIVYRTLENYAEAIADLEIAAHLFAEHGNKANAQKAQETLVQVRQLADSLPLATPEPAITTANDPSVGDAVDTSTHQETFNEAAAINDPDLLANQEDPNETVIATSVDVDSPTVERSDVEESAIASTDDPTVNDTTDMWANQEPFDEVDTVEDADLSVDQDLFDTMTSFDEAASINDVDPAVDESLYIARHQEAFDEGDTVDASSGVVDTVDVSINDVDPAVDEDIYISAHQEAFDEGDTVDASNGVVDTIDASINDVDPAVDEDIYISTHQEAFDDISAFDAIDLNGVHVDSRELADSDEELADSDEELADSDEIDVEVQNTLAATPVSLAHSSEMAFAQDAESSMLWPPSGDDDVIPTDEISDDGYTILGAEQQVLAPSPEQEDVTLPLDGNEDEFRLAIPVPEPLENAAEQEELYDLFEGLDPLASNVFDEHGDEFPTGAPVPDSSEAIPVQEGSDDLFDALDTLAFDDPNTLEPNPSEPNFQEPDTPELFEEFELEPPVEARPDPAPPVDFVDHSVESIVWDIDDADVFESTHEASLENGYGLGEEETVLAEDEALSEEYTEINLSADSSIGFVDHSVESIVWDVDDADAFNSSGDALNGLLSLDHGSISDDAESPAPDEVFLMPPVENHESDALDLTPSAEGQEPSDVLESIETIFSDFGENEELPTPVVDDPASPRIMQTSDISDASQQTEQPVEEVDESETLRSFFSNFKDSAPLTPSSHQNGLYSETAEQSTGDRPPISLEDNLDFLLEDNLPDEPTPILLNELDLTLEEGPEQPRSSDDTLSETDAQQIGTQTLADFFSAINAENDIDPEDIALFSEKDFPPLPDLDLPLPDLELDDLDDEFVGSEATAKNVAHPAEASNSEQPDGLNDLFFDLPEHQSVPAHASNGNSHSNSMDSSTKHSLSDKELLDDTAFQTVDEESLSDFCQRFTI